MNEEFAFHIQMETARLVSRGLSEREAHRRARASFGGLDRHREEMRDERGTSWLDDAAADLGYALRAMRRSPGFAIAVAVTLGVGIGVNGIIFSFVNSILFRPIPVSDAQGLVAMFTRDTRSGDADQLDYDDYLDFRDRSGAFAGLAAMNGVPLNLASGGDANSVADLVWGEIVSENFFSVLQMRPTLGRFFTESDAPQGANPFAVLSYDAWRHRFHGDTAVIGRRIRLNGTEFTIVAVAASGFHGMRSFGFWPELWVPLGMHRAIMPGSTALAGRGDGWLLTVGRMRSGWSLQQTQRVAEQFAARLAVSFPATNAHTSVMIIPARSGFDNPTYIKPKILVLVSATGILAATVMLLLICANLANVQLARAAGRAREIAIRLSLGCSRKRLTRQLLVESVVLAVPGAIIGSLLVLLSPLIEASLLPHMQHAIGFDTRADWRVTTFTASLGLVAAVLFGLLPSLRATRSDIVVSLSSVIGGRRRTGRFPFRLRSALVVTQLAMSVVLLVAGTLFVRSLLAARGADVGFDPSNRLIASVNVELQGYDEARGRRFYDDVLARVRALPNVVAASWVFPVPFDGFGTGINLYVNGMQASSETPAISIDASYAAEDFVKALGLRMLAGRGFTVSDSAGSPAVMVVSRSMATRLWPGKDPIGQRARRGGPSGTEVTVIGVVADARYVMLESGPAARAYIPQRQHYRGSSTLVIDARDRSTDVIATVRLIIAKADPTLPVYGVTTMAANVRSGFAVSSSAAYVFGFFGALALVIASVGLYAVVASSVAERTREIGVRIALGSTPSGVLRLVLRGSARLGIVGLSVGLLLAAAVSRGMGSLLMGLSASDPVTFVLVPVALAIVVFIATYLPARKAVRLDPIAALRSD